MRGLGGSRPARPATSDPVTVAPPGDLLSCYTASVAHYLARLGADAELAVGTQLFLAVRIGADDRLAFVHHHTPLRGDRLTHRVELVHRHAADPDVAVRCILDELRGTGAVVVAGDVATMPWQVGFGKRHAPHWLVVDDVNQVGGTVHVTDLFEFVGEHGEQQSHAGWVPVDQLATLARPPEEATAVWAARDRHAFGDIDERPAADGHYQWFEATRPPEARAVGVDEAMGLLHETWAHHTGAQRRGDLDDASWRCGVDAIVALADWLEPRLGDQATYAVADDIWVAARNRQLFARVTGHLAAEMGRPALGDVAIRAAELSDEWAGVPRVLAYNAQSVARGREPRQFPVTLLRRIAELEAGVLDELGRAVTVEACR